MLALWMVYRQMAVITPIDWAAVLCIICKSSGCGGITVMLFLCVKGNRQASELNHVQSSKSVYVPCVAVKLLFVCIM